MTSEFLLYFNWHQNKNWPYYLHKETVVAYKLGKKWGQEKVGTGL